MRISVNGLDIFPKNTLDDLILSITDFFPTAAPATISLCPPSYLVTEYNTTSAPKSIGLDQIGPIKVLSINNSALFFFVDNFFANSEHFSISII